MKVLPVVVHTSSTRHEIYESSQQQRYRKRLNSDGTIGWDAE